MSTDRSAGGINPGTRCVSEGDAAADVDTRSKLLFVVVNHFRTR